MTISAPVLTGLFVLTVTSMLQVAGNYALATAGNALLLIFAIVNILPQLVRSRNVVVIVGVAAMVAMLRLFLVIDLNTASVASEIKVAGIYLLWLAALLVQDVKLPFNSLDKNKLRFVFSALLLAFINALFFYAVGDSAYSYTDKVRSVRNLSGLDVQLWLLTCALLLHPRRDQLTLFWFIPIISVALAQAALVSNRTALGLAGIVLLSAVYFSYNSITFRLLLATILFWSLAAIVATISNDDYLATKWSASAFKEGRFMLASAQIDYFREFINIFDKQFWFGLGVGADLNLVGSWTLALEQKRNIEFDFFDIFRLYGAVGSGFILLALVLSKNNLIRITLLVGWGTGHVFFNIPVLITALLYSGKQTPFFRKLL